MNLGYIWLWRKFLDSPVWRARNQAQGRVAITCLLMANHKAARLSIGGEVVELKPGEFWTSIPALSDRAGVSVKQVRNSLVNLQKLDFLADKGTANGRKISIINWDSYQAPKNQVGRQVGRRWADLGQTEGSKQEGKNERMKEIRREELPPVPPLPRGESSDGDPPVSTKPRVKYKGRVKPAIETMPEEEYIAQVNTAFASLRTLVEDQWVDSENLKRWLVTYDRINVDGQIRMAKQWLLDNAGDPKKRRKNFNSFTAGWLGRSQTQAEQEGTCYKPEKDEDDGYSISPERLAEIDAIEAEIARSGGRKTLSERQAEIKALKAGVAKEEEAGHPKPNGD